MKFESLKANSLFDSFAAHKATKLNSVLGGLGLVGGNTDNNADSIAAGKNGDDCTDKVGPSDDNPSDDGHCD
ncbi:MAG: hypothetical protein AAGG68_21550 [Bacteroidota bacterium]